MAEWDGVGLGGEHVWCPEGERGGQIGVRDGEVEVVVEVGECLCVGSCRGGEGVSLV